MPINADISAPAGSVRRDRLKIAQLLEEYKHAKEDGASQRGISEALGIPRTTLQHWETRQQAIGMTPATLAFFESPEGIEFIHRLVVALHLVVGWMGNGGIRLIGMIINLCGLGCIIATSYGVHQRISEQMQQNIVEYGKHEQQRLAKDMPHKKISIAEDETFLSSDINLVAIEPVSGYVLAEQYEKSRDAKSWNAVLKSSTEGLNVEVIQSVSDEARGLKRHAKDIGAHHSPDLFHVSNEVNRAMALPLLHRQNQAQREFDGAHKRLERQLKAKETYFSKPRRGRNPKFDQKIQQAEEDKERAREHLQFTQQQQLGWRDALGAISAAYHPFDLKTGRPRTAEQFVVQISAVFDELRNIAVSSKLSTRSVARIEKAARVVPLMVDTLRFFHESVDKRIAALELPAGQAVLLKKWLLPASYLRRCIQRASNSAQRAELQEHYADLFGEAPLVTDLSNEEGARLEVAAIELADIFQRSSSCVEGRNGRLSQWEHAQRRLSPKKLQGLTVIHNFVIRRPDGTTAAQRFFGKEPHDLFDWLLARIPYPPRPAAKRIYLSPQPLLQTS